MDEFLVIVLTSTVISSLITVLSSVLLNQKKNSLEYITSERKLWRQEIREIAEEIEIADKNNINIPLSKLKVRINAYDCFFVNQQDSGDYFIWNMINMCEKADDPELLNVLKKNLIMGISLMLKYDWERSKKEIAIDKNNMIIVLSIILQIIFFLLLNPILKLNVRICAVLIISYIVMLILTNGLVEVRNNRVSIETERNRNGYEFRIYTTFAIILLILIVSVFALHNILIKEYTISSIFLIIIISESVLMPTMIFLLFKQKKSLLSKYRMEYIRSMDRLINNLNKEIKEKSFDKGI